MNHHEGEEQDCMFFSQKVITSPATSVLPSMAEFGGVYNFQMEVGQLGVENKRQSWQYSPLLKKVFIIEGRSLPLQFRVAREHPAGLYVRAVACYCNPDAANLPVLRCINHVQLPADPINIGYNHLDHVVSCNHRSAVYEVDVESQRRSVSVMLSGPQPGSEWETIMYAMMCRSSCSTGINRRPLALIFTLEMQYQVLGRKVLPLRVCASPFRDRTLEENKLIKSEVIDEVNSPSAEPAECVGSLNDSYFVPVVDYNDYILLTSQAKELVEKEFPAGPLRESEIDKYNVVLMSANNFN